MTRQVTKLFLQAYFEKKEQFRDPKIRKKTIWTQIYNVRTRLQRKRKHIRQKDAQHEKVYRTIKDNNKKSSTERGRIHWEYFDIFEDIFRNDATINHGPTLFSMINLVPLTSTDENSIPSTSTDENSLFISTNKQSELTEINNQVILYHLYYIFLNQQ